LDPLNLNVPQLLWTRLAVAVSMAGLGGLAAVSFKRISHVWLCGLISFAAGALLSVAFFDILPEAVEAVGIRGAGLAALSGYVLFFFLSRFVSHVCPACAATHTESQFKTLTWTLVVALSVHSSMDGLAIASGYQMDSKLGMLVLLAVAYHKLPEGLALTLVARGSGMSRARAFALALGIETATTLGGGVAGMATAAAGSGLWPGLILAHVAGGFVYIVIHALLIEVVKHHPRVTVAAALLGGASMFLAAALAGPAAPH